MINSRFDRVAGVNPGIQPTFDGCNLFITMTDQDLRRPGAAVLGRSGAVGDDPLVGRNFVQAVFYRRE
jgi:hypothetical protein